MWCKMFNKQELETLNSIATYLKLHNNIALYNGLKEIIDKVMRYREKDNARKLKYITEKRKENKEYGGHSKDRYKKGGNE